MAEKRLQRSNSDIALAARASEAYAGTRRGGDVHFLLDRRRLLREAAWNDANTLEQEVLEPYLLDYKTGNTGKSHEQFMERSRRQVDVVLQTNDRLQQRLKEQEDLIVKLKQQREEKEEEWEEIRDELNIGKQEHEKVIAQLHILRDQRLSEESRLRARRNELHSRVIHLSQDNCRLEKMRREEELLMARQDGVINELHRVVVKLEARKAQFELRQKQMDRDLEEVRVRSPVRDFDELSCGSDFGDGDDDDEGLPEVRWRVPAEAP